MRLHFETEIMLEEASFSLEVLTGDTIDCVFHTHREYELTWVESSYGTRFVGDAVETFLPGDLMLIGGQLPHHYQTDRANGETGWVKVLVVKLSGMLVDSLSKLPECGRLQQMFRRSAHGLWFSPETVAAVGADLGRLPEISGCERLVLLLDILRRLSESPGREVSAGGGFSDDPADERPTRILRYIQDLLKQGDPVTLEKTAARFYMTPTSFSHYFRRVMRRSFVDYVIELKLSRASQLLIQTDMPILEIATEAGFRNLSNFNRLFRGRKQITPREYRNCFHPGA